MSIEKQCRQMQYYWSVWGLLDTVPKAQYLWPVCQHTSKSMCVIDTFCGVMDCSLEVSRCDSLVSPEHPA